MEVTNLRKPHLPFTKPTIENANPTLVLCARTFAWRERVRRCGGLDAHAKGFARFARQNWNHFSSVTKLLSHSLNAAE